MFPLRSFPDWRSALLILIPTALLLLAGCAQGGRSAANELGGSGNVSPLPPDRAHARMTQEYCESTRGGWSGSDCLCGGIAGFLCPSGYNCTDMVPSPSAPDAMGVCKPN